MNTLNQRDAGIKDGWLAEMRKIFWKSLSIFRQHGWVVIMRKILNFTKIPGSDVLVSRSFHLHRLVFQLASQAEESGRGDGQPWKLERDIFDTFTFQNQRNLPDWFCNLCRMATTLKVLLSDRLLDPVHLVLVPLPVPHRPLLRLLQRRLKCLHPLHCCPKPLL